MLVALDLFFKTSNIRLILNNFLLRVPHLLILLYFEFNSFDFILDGLAKLFEKLNAIVDVFIFALIEFSNVGLDVAMVEICVGFHMLVYYLLLIWDSDINFIILLGSISRQNGVVLFYRICDSFVLIKI
jgi:hypothetical protein